MSPDDEIGKSTALSNNAEDPKNKLINYTNFECLQEDQGSGGDKIASKKTNSIEESRHKSQMGSDYSQ
jgi:hypothetical protein